MLGRQADCNPRPPRVVSASVKNPGPGNATGWMLKCRVRLGCTETISRRGDSTLSFAALLEQGVDSIRIPVEPEVFVVYSLDQVSVVEDWPLDEGRRGTIDIGEGEWKPDEGETEDDAESDHSFNGDVDDLCEAVDSTERRDGTKEEESQALRVGGDSIVRRPTDATRPVIDIAPEQVRFSRASVAAYYRSGRPIRSTLAELVLDPRAAQKIPRCQVVNFDGKLSCFFEGGGGR